MVHVITVTFFMFSQNLKDVTLYVCTFSRPMIHLCIVLLPPPALSVICCL